MTTTQQIALAIAALLSVATLATLTSIALEATRTRKRAEPRPTLPDDWRRPDCTIYIGPRGEYVTQEVADEL